MTITAKIVADSMSPAGIRLTTFQLRYPRFIHSELMTHRVFSRNASSSRAIPVQKMIDELRRDPAMPVFWGSNKPGMQAGDELEGDHLLAAKGEWLNAMNRMIASAEYLISVGLHKQIANRILEPWAHINVVVTATDYQNFFLLRRHKDAQPEIRVLADEMFIEGLNSEPKLLEPGAWHLPYINLEDAYNAGARYHGQKLSSDTLEEKCIDDLKKVSVARCARVSYLTHDGRQTTLEEDLELYNRLLGAQPLHASPAEHQATPDNAIQHGHRIVWNYPEQHGNFRGWRQLRKMLPNEFIPG